MRFVTRRNHVPTFARVLDTFFNEENLKNLEEGLTIWNGSQPAVNVKEDAEAYSLEVAAPGYEKDAFEIKVEDEVLTISTEKKEVEEAKEGEKYTRREFKYNAFKRSFNLPETADATKIAASYTNGILSVSIPKKEEAKPLPARTIEIS